MGQFFGKSRTFLIKMDYQFTTGSKSPLHAVGVNRIVAVVVDVVKVDFGLALVTHYDSFLIAEYATKTCLYNIFLNIHASMSFSEKERSCYRLKAAPNLTFSP
jgi:hypothetical protein